MKRLLVTCAFLLLMSNSFAPIRAQGTPTPAAAGWREDLQFLWQNIQDTHPDPFRAHPRADFERMVSDLDTGIPNMTDEQIVVGLLRVVAALQDGHSSIWFQQTDYPFRYYPLYFYPFSDGVYLIQAAPQYANLIGSRLVQIGTTEAASVMDALRPLAPRDNDSSALVTIPMMMSLADVLLGTGMIADAAQPTYLLERPDGERVTLNPVPESYSEFSTAIPVQWRLPQADKPLSLSRVDEAFWWTYLDGEQAIYVQYNQVTTRSAGTNATISALTAELTDALAAHPVKRLILDMRYNAGGDINTARPLRTFLNSQPFFHQPSNLIVLVGHNTFSAAMVFTLWLEQDIDPIFMGEPTGGQPLMFENARQITLPNSRLVGQIATRARQDVDSEDLRRALEPQVMIPLSSSDYFNGIDPVLDAALTYRAPAM